VFILSCVMFPESTFQENSASRCAMLLWEVCCIGAIGGGSVKPVWVPMALAVVEIPKADVPTALLPKWLLLRVTSRCVWASNCDDNP
jgi:hypothetical protein